MEAQGHLAFGCCSPVAHEGLSDTKLQVSLVTLPVGGGKLAGLQATDGWIWFGTRVVVWVFFFNIRMRWQDLNIGYFHVRIPFWLLVKTRPLDGTGLQSPLAAICK